MFTYDSLKRRIDEDKALRRKPLKGFKGDKKLVERLFGMLEEEKRKVPINIGNVIGTMEDIALEIWGFAVCGQYKLAYHYLSKFSAYRNIELIYMHDNIQN